LYPSLSTLGELILSMSGDDVMSQFLGNIP
jgi:hypothetical protein